MKLFMDASDIIDDRIDENDEDSWIIGPLGEEITEELNKIYDKPGKSKPSKESKVLYCTSDTYLRGHSLESYQTIAELSRKHNDVLVYIENNERTKSNAQIYIEQLRVRCFDNLNKLKVAL